MVGEDRPFLGLTEAELAARCPGCQQFVCGHGQMLYREGQPATHTFRVLQGVVKLYRMLPDGRHLTIAVLGRGETFGHLPGDERAEGYGENAEGLGEGVMLRLPFVELERWLASDAAAVLELMRLVCRRRRHSELRLQRLVSEDLQTRVRRTLVELGRLCAVRCTHGYALEIRLTQQDIADLVHASRPAVAEVMGALRRQGLLDYRRDLICVHDEALEAGVLSPG